MPAACSVSSGFAIEGPSQAKIECEDQNDGSCDVRYWPTEPGEYAVHVTCDDEDIEHSPFMACIVPDNNASDPNKVDKMQENHHRTSTLKMIRVLIEYLNAVEGSDLSS